MISCSRGISIKKLTKKEKQRLEDQNKSRFDKFVERFNKKSDQYLEKMMPSKIPHLTLLFKNLGNLQDALEKVNKDVELPPIPDVTLKKIGERDNNSESQMIPQSKKRKIDQSNGDISRFSEEIEQFARKAPRTDTQIERLKTHVLSNQRLIAVLESIKREALEFLEMVGSLKIWIQLNIPRIEDGNNFGVAVQEEIVGELSAAEDAAFGILEHTTKYFVSRGKVVSKVLKWPELIDYRTAVKESDEKEYIQLRLDCLDLRNHYLTLFDLIQKNFEKLKKPRSSDAFRSMF